MKKIVSKDKCVGENVVIEVANGRVHFIPLRKNDFEVIVFSFVCGMEGEKPNALNLKEKSKSMKISNLKIV